MQNHVYPRAILLGPSPVGIVSALLEERLGDLVVDVLLLEVVLVLDRDLAVEVLQPGPLLPPGARAAVCPQQGILSRFLRGID